MVGSKDLDLVHFQRGQVLSCDGDDDHDHYGNWEGGAPEEKRAREDQSGECGLNVWWWMECELEFAWTARTCVKSSLWDGLKLK